MSQSHLTSSRPRLAFRLTLHGSLLVLLVMFLAACADSGGGPAPGVIGITIEEFRADEVGVAGAPTHFAWRVGHSVEGEALSCRLEPGDGSAPLSIADCGLTTSASHVYEAAGTVRATLTVSDSAGRSATDIVSVTIGVPNRVERVIVDGGDRSLPPGLSLDMTATVEATGDLSRAVTWSSSDANVLSVDATGTITGLQVGTAVLTATSVADPSKFGAVTITVTPAMILTIDTSLVSGNTFHLPLRGTGVVTVYWGDGQVEEITDPEGRDHTYESEGVYTIRVTGALAGEPHYGGASSYTGVAAVSSVSSWGELGLTSLEGAFRGARSLTTVPSELPSTVTNLEDMFWGAHAFDHDISGWDTSNVTNMHGLFHGARSFNQDIGSWNTSNVIFMQDVFRGARSFNQDVSGWDTSNVDNMVGLFYGAWEFNQDIGGWDTSNVTNMKFTFYDARQFNQDIGGWDTSNVIDMMQMFANALTFNQDLSGWCVAQIPVAPSVFRLGTPAWTLPKPNWGAPCGP